MQSRIYETVDRLLSVPSIDSGMELFAVERPRQEIDQQQVRHSAATALCSAANANSVLLTAEGLVLKVITVI